MSYYEAESTQTCKLCSKTVKVQREPYCCNACRARIDEERAAKIRPFVEEQIFNYAAASRDVDNRRRQLEALNIRVQNVSDRLAESMDSMSRAMRAITDVLAANSDVSDFA